jgi:hypothetical protein
VHDKAVVETEPIERENIEPKQGLNREDSAVDTADDNDSQAADEQHIQELVSLLERARSELAKQHQELNRLRQDTEQRIRQIQDEHEAEIDGLNAKHAQQTSEQEQEAAKLREEVAKLRIQVEDYIVFRGNVEQERWEREALEQAEHKKQVRDSPCPLSYLERFYM